MAVPEFAPSEKLTRGSSPQVRTVPVSEARSTKKLMLTPQCILTSIILLLPALCQGQETCLWMNAATAEGLLGAAVTATVSRPNANTSNPHTANAKSSAGPTSADPSGPAYLTSRMDDSDCAFVTHSGPVAAELRIHVRTMDDPPKDFASYLAHCGANATPLKAIGTAAFACTPGVKGRQIEQQIVGNVRDRVFVVRLSTKDRSSGNMLEEHLRQAADIVAGNLF